MASMKQLDAEKRERVGKGAARATRRDHRVPAVIYGGGQAPVSISLDYNRTNQLIYAGHFLTTVFEIKVADETIRAIPRDYQLHPVKDTPVHVDFLRLAVGSTIRVEVPVHFINHEASPGLKQGGALNIVRHALGRDGRSCRQYPRQPDGGSDRSCLQRRGEDQFRQAAGRHPDRDPGPRFHHRDHHAAQAAG
jgi:ribosomal protein bL25 (Ctc-form)